MPITMVLIIAVSLSMDAFSLSLAYGTLNMEKYKMKLLSLIVGIYHFFMPLIGMYVGKKVIMFLPIQPNVLVCIVLLFIGIEMIIESFKSNRELKVLKFTEFIIFGFAVSIDSFSVGLGLKAIYNNPYIASLIFSLSSLSFTYMGLKLGKKINDAIGRISTLLGGIVLIIIGILYLI